MSSIGQIKQDLEALEKIVTEVSEELKSLYRNYLNLLADSTQKQVVLASYQICTQIYPESFLRLSFSQRQKLQQNLRKLGKEIKSNLLSYLENYNSKEENQESEGLNLIEAMIKNLPFAENQAQGSNQELIESDLSSADAESLEEYQEQTTTIDEENSISSPDYEEEELAESSQINLSNPHNLIRWQQRIEKGIKQTLDQLSREGNRCLQEVGIIPNRLPSKIMDVAIQAEEGGAGSKFNHLANILNIAIEMEKDKTSKQANLTQISLLRLRLSEIEFSDPILNAERNKIRTLLKKIQKLRQQYQVKQKEYATAEAQAAWRSSWYED